MSLDLSSERFEALLAAPEGVERVRELILQLAVRGKVVNQQPTDTPADLLLERIAEERRQLAEAGEIQGSRKLPEVTQEEVPFGIPDSWKWTRFQEPLLEHRLGKMLDRGKNRGKLRPYLRNQNVRWFHFDLSDTKRMRVPEDDLEAVSALPGDLLVCEGGEPGRAAVWDRDEPFVLQKALHRARPASGVNPHYLALFLRAEADSGRLASAFTGATIKHLTGQSLKRYPCPLPPEQEQERLVARVNELVNLCKRVKAAHNEREETRERLLESALAALTQAEKPEEAAGAWDRIASNFHDLFSHPDHVQPLRRTILDLAVRGKLLPQCKEDPPAMQILKEAAADRQRQLSGGRQRKQTRLRIRIQKDELRFVPDRWEVSFIDECFQVTGGIQKTPDRRPRNNAFSYLRVANVQRGWLDLSQLEKFELREGELERYRLAPGDVLVVEGNGSESEIGRCAIWNGEIEDCVYQNHLIRCRPYVDGLEKFILLFLNSPTGTFFMKRLAVTTSGLYNLSVGKIRAIPVPIPPLPEQRRIVAKVEKFLSACDSVADCLEHARNTARTYADALLASLER